MQRGAEVRAAQLDQVGPRAVPEAGGPLGVDRHRPAGVRPAGRPSRAARPRSVIGPATGPLGHQQRDGARRVVFGAAVDRRRRCAASGRRRPPAATSGTPTPSITGAGICGTYRAARTEVASRRPGGAGAVCSGNDSGAHRQRHHVRAVAGAELAPDPGQMALHGQRRQRELLADPLVGPAVGDQPDDLDLPAWTGRGCVLGMLDAAGLARRPISTPLTPAPTASMTGPMSAVGASAMTRGQPDSRRAWTTPAGVGPELQADQGQVAADLPADEVLDARRPTTPPGSGRRRSRPGSSAAARGCCGPGSTTRIVAIRSGVGRAIAQRGALRRQQGRRSSRSSARRGVLAAESPAAHADVELLTGRPPTRPSRCAASPLSGTPGARRVHCSAGCSGVRVVPLSQLVSALRPSVVKHPKRPVTVRPIGLT